MRRGHARPHHLRAVVPGLCLLVIAAACTHPDDTGRTPIDPLALRPLSVSSDNRFVDDLDREVLLRGANITSLGEYWQGNPDHSPTLPTTDQDWDAMAARGFSVVRLVVHWSRLEAEVDEAGGMLVVWTPTTADSHELWSEGLEALEELEVPGGRWLTATVSGGDGYAIGVDPR